MGGYRQFMRAISLDIFHSGLWRNLGNPGQYWRNSVIQDRSGRISFIQMHSSVGAVRVVIFLTCTSICRVPLFIRLSSCSAGEVALSRAAVVRCFSCFL